jgi:RNA polymerase sigma factor (sigma-70 family)
MSAGLTLAQIRSNPDDSIRQMYRDYRMPFIRWAKGWTNLQDSDLDDVFQDAIIKFWDNIRTGRLQTLTASLKTYLFGIGRNLLHERNRRWTPPSLPDQETLPPDLLGLDYGAEQQMIQEEERNQMATALNQLGDPCATLLRLTFYERLKSEEIVPIMNYASADVVRQRRSHCLKRLRDLIKH